MMWKFLLLCPLLFSLSLNAAPKKVKKEQTPKISSWNIDSAHSSANFKVKHFGVSTVRGLFSGVSGEVKADENNIANSSVTAKIDVSSINSGVAKRDEHLKSDDFFDVAKFPTMTFVSTKLARNKQGKLEMTGNLTIKDKTKEVVLAVSEPTKPVKNMAGGLSVGVSATTTINRQDFGLNWSKIVEGISAVSDEVQIELELELTSQK